jgi:hypothetical protein
MLSEQFHAQRFCSLLVKGNGLWAASRLAGTGYQRIAKVRASFAGFKRKLNNFGILDSDFLRLNQPIEKCQNIGLRLFCRQIF